MPRHIDHWATIDRGPICARSNEPKRNHGYYSKAYRCMSLRNSVFTKKTIHPSLTIKRRKEKDSMAKAKIVKMPKLAKKKTLHKHKTKNN